MQNKLTKLQAYNVMLFFLEEFYEKDESQYLGDILSNSEFWTNGLTADRGSWSDWKKAICITVLQDKKIQNQNRFTALQACNVMFNYINNYVSYYKIKPDYLIDLLEILQNLCDGKNQEMWQKWLKIVDKVIDMPDPRYYLEFVKFN